MNRLRTKNGVGRSLRNFLQLILISAVLAACGGGGGGGDSSASATNDGPSISGAPVSSVTQNVAYSFVPTAQDNDNDTLLFSIANRPVWAGFDTATGELTGTPSSSDVGTTAGIVISVDDQQGQANSTATLPAFDLTVNSDNSPNDAPTISGAPATSVGEDSSYGFTPTSGDVNGDTLLFSIANRPVWASFDSATGELSGTPANAHVGITTGIVISVDDQRDQSNSVASLAAFSVTVDNVNDQPNISGSPVTRIGELAPYSFTPSANDSDPTGDTLLFSIINKPAWASFDPVTGMLTGTPTSAELGTSPNIVISVDDQQGAPNSVASLPAFDIDVVQGFNEALFATPTVSSFTVERRRYQANDGINVNLADPNSKNGWLSAEDETDPSAESWIQLDFDTTKTIYRVTLSDLLNTGDNLLQGVIEFSDGSSIPLTTPLPVNGAPVDFVFEPKQVDWIRLSQTQAVGSFGLAEITAYSMLTPNQTLLAQDLFNDGNDFGWTIKNDDCQKGTGVWAAGFTFWPGNGSGFQYQQSDQCRGFSTEGEGVELGTYALKNRIFAAGIDIRLSMRSDDDGTDQGWQVGAMGVLFGYQDLDNYYRLDLSLLEGHRKLYKKVAGVFTELNSSPQSYTPGAHDSAGWELTYPDGWVNLRVVHHNGVILVYVNGTKVLAVEDSTFNGGKVALLCARNRFCAFDNVVWLDGPTDPIAGVNIDHGTPHRSSEYFVTTGDTLAASAVLTSSTGVNSVEFVLDEGLPGETSLTDAFGPPYDAQFDLLPAGEHTLSVHLLDGSGKSLAGAEASATLPQLGTGGIHLVAVGDSITAGTSDLIASDNTSMDGRNTSGGFQPVLNDHLSSDNPGKPVTVINEGNSAETSAIALARFAVLLEITPAAQAYLLMYGANDSRSSILTESGLGLSSGDRGYAGTFKDNMQRMIDMIRAEGKEVYLAKTSPHLTDSVRDDVIKEYNDVIDELVAENGFTYTPPDFHAYFKANPGEMKDSLHPNGVGYQSMARLWCDSLDQPGMLCRSPY